MAYSLRKYPTVLMTWCTFALCSDSEARERLRAEKAEERAQMLADVLSAVQQELDEARFALAFPNECLY